MVSSKKKQTNDYADIICKFKSGDQKAATEIYKIINTFSRKIIRQKIYVIQCTKLEELSHEITSEILTKKLSYFNSEKQLFPWLYRIVSNKIIDNYRREKHSFFNEKKLCEINDNLAPDLISNTSNLEEVFLEEKTALIHEVLRFLPKHKRELVLLYYFDNTSLKEISKSKNRSVSAITLELFRIRAFLKAYLIKRGFKQIGEK